jgi:hypothetical protein
MSLLLALMVATLAVGAIMMTGNGTLLAKFHANEVMMQAAADAGLEQARDTLNGTPAIIPAAGFVTLELNKTVKDAAGRVIPGFTRSTYAGKSGNVTGQYGVFASVITVISNPRGAVVVRRGELAQESFAKFARFDNQTTSSVVFSGGIQVFGPLHTNGTLYVSNSGGAPTFHGPVTTASTISTPAGGIFRMGYRQNTTTIPMPSPTSLATLRAYATGANLQLTGGATGVGVYDADTRVEFVPVDINGDGDFADEGEGFIRVFKATVAGAPAKTYVSARLWNTMPTPAGSVPSGVSTASDPNFLSPNCGGTWNGAWWTADSVWAKAAGTLAQRRDAVRAALNSGTRRCYLGGDPRLYPGGLAFKVSDTRGAWQLWPGWGGGAANAAIAAGKFTNGQVVGATAAKYLWPINRTFNLNFKGVIYVDGSVAVSGQVRGRVTLAASSNIMLADDLTYVTAPGSDPNCEADILGLLTPHFFMIEDNSVNSPFFVNGAYVKGFDDSADESIHGAVLTLESISSENLGGGSNNSETCVTKPIGRGCFNMFGSAIQDMNAARMSGSGTGYTGWNPQWSYDRCMAIAPPPYYPTTGRYIKNRYYEIDPVGFNVTQWFTDNQTGI